MKIVSGKNLALTAVISLCLTLVSVSSVQSARLPIPSGAFYYQPAATVFGSEAAWVNPAALGWYRAQSYQFLVDYYDGRLAKSWGLVTSGERMAFAYRRVDNPSGDDFIESIIATGFSFSQKAYVGGSYRYFREGPEPYNNRHSWNFSLLLRGNSPFSAGAVLSNVNRNRVDGVRTETETRYSLGYRPANGKLTLAADMFLSTKTRLSNADFVYHLEVRPKPGLYLYAGLDSDRDFQVGMRANLLRYFVGSKSGFNRDGDGRGTTVFSGATSLRQPSLIPEPGRRLSLNIRGSLPENPPRPYIGRRQTSFTETILNIYRAAEDASISEMVLNLSRPRVGFAQAQELREALRYFRSRGKEITCHVSYPNNIAYFVGSVADRLLIPPVSQLNLVGLRAELTFYAGTLNKLGIKADIIHIGGYKTAPERYTRESASPENRQQLNRLLDELYDQFVGAIAAGRSLTPDSVRTIIDHGPFTSEEALRFGLVDGLSYRDEVKDQFLSDCSEISFNYYMRDTLTNDAFAPKPVVAVVVADGDIADEGQKMTPFDQTAGTTPGRMRRALERAMARSDVKAVVLRINSPGGLALAADDIHHLLQKSAAKKPLIVSMANVAASGGYQIAMPASRIFASDATVTGSIGIYGGKADLSGLYEKIGMGKELFTRGRFAGMLSTVKPFTDDERDKYASHLQAFYDYFVGLVADSRHLPVDSVESLARGQVFTGREAVALGLADESGGLKQALDFVAEELHLDDYRVVVYPEDRPLLVLAGQRLWGQIASIFTGSDRASSVLPGEFSALEGGGFLLARMPYNLIIE